MNIVGIDSNAGKIAAVVTVGEQPRLLRVALTRKDVPRSCHDAEAWAYRVCSKLDAPYVYVEQPMVARSGAKVMMQLSRIMACIEAGAYRGGAKVVGEVHPSTWKSKVVGKGNASKAQVAEWCYQAWREVYVLADGDQDLIDAAAINRYAHKMHSTRR